MSGPRKVYTPADPDEVVAAAHLLAGVEPPEWLWQWRLAPTLRVDSVTPDGQPLASFGRQLLCDPLAALDSIDPETDPMLLTQADDLEVEAALKKPTGRAQAVKVALREVLDALHALALDGMIRQVEARRFPFYNDRLRARLASALHVEMYALMEEWEALQRPPQEQPAPQAAAQPQGLPQPVPQSCAVPELQRLVGERLRSPVLPDGLPGPLHDWLSHLWADTHALREVVVQLCEGLLRETSPETVDHLLIEYGDRIHEAIGERWPMLQALAAETQEERTTLVARGQRRQR